MKTGFWLLLLLLFSSCLVSKKKYDTLQAHKVILEAEVNRLGREHKSVLARLESVESAMIEWKKDSTWLMSEYEAIEKKWIDLLEKHAQLQADHQSLLNSSGELSRHMQDQKDRLLTSQQNLERVRQSNDSLSVDLTKREKRIQELEDILLEERETLQGLKDRIAETLFNFKENDLTVTLQQGNVYVSMAEQLLFSSGSIVIGDKGKRALAQLATVLKDQEELSIKIEGHTDNVPISRPARYMQDNWDLSVLRATAITRIFIQQGLAPDRVTPAGKGEYMPLAPNTTDENKKNNRRIEIVITPNLESLYETLTLDTDE